MAQYLIVGAGKLAKHLNHYFSHLGLPVQNWDRSQDPHLIKTKIHEATHVLLAISDGALQSFFWKHLAGLDKKVVHFSGALTLEDVIAAHPLMSFGPDLYPIETYQKIHFAVTGAQKLSDALPGLENPFTVLPAEQKALYHALCVLGGNFPVILWQKMFSEFAKLGISENAAHLYLQTVLSNTLQNPMTALTGPLARKDSATVLKNLEALQGDSFQKVYEAFVQATAPELLPLQKERPL